MEISINYQGNLIKEFTPRRRNLAILTLSFFDLNQLQQGILTPSLSLKDLFHNSVLGFNPGILMMALLGYVVLLGASKYIGEYLKEKEISSVVYYIISVAILIAWCFGW